MGTTTALASDPEIRAELQLLLEKYGRDRSALKPILHALQERYHRIPSEHSQILADLLKIHPIAIQEVISFYSFYNSEPKGKYIIRMCRTMPCQMVGAREVARQLEKVLGSRFGETTPDGKFTLEWTNCLGLCDQGPAFLLNGRPYVRVTVNEVARIIQECQ